MADNPHLLATAQEVGEEGAATMTPVMPHCEHTDGELNRLYPSLVAPPDGGLDDGDVDERDGVYQHGLALADRIREQTISEGRRKRPLASVRHPLRQPEQPDGPVCGGVTRGGMSHGRKTGGRGSRDGGNRSGARQYIDGDDGVDDPGDGDGDHGRSCISESDSRDFALLVCDQLLQAFLFKYAHLDHS